MPDSDATNNGLNTVKDNEPAYTVVTSALEVERIDRNLFRSKTLTIPWNGRGVYGGQVISQAVVCATECVDPQYHLHSLHCYFLLNASADTPILYHVDRLREGRTYTTRSVKAVQDGSAVFVMLCSFQKPEPLQPSHQWIIPFSLVPRPEETEADEDVYEKLAERAPSEWIASNYKRAAVERRKSPITVRSLKGYTTQDGNKVYMYWMRAKGVQKYEPPFQKCILGYISDLHFVGSAARALGLSKNASGPSRLAMTSSLDHTIHFYGDFDCSDWLLYVVTSPRTGSGRGIVHGEMYTSTGQLAAVVAQEGVVRADVGRPPKAKL